MNLKEVNQVRQKLIEFVDLFRPSLGRAERRHWCQLYLAGLLLHGERKSIQPIAERVPGGNEQALQQFVNQSPWDHEEIQTDLTSHLKKLFKLKTGVLVLDDTSLPKKGRYSVGVARQYCGALGKVANCQSVVTWHYAQKEGRHFPLCSELYLPENWIADKKRLKQSGC